MGKLDDMRKHREAQFAQRERAAAASTDASAPAEPPADEPPADEPAPQVSRTSSRLGRASRGGAAEEGSCSVCGKTRPLQNGVVAAHQKGLGKVCAGSRKPPA